jgi:hypothetical protein
VGAENCIASYKTYINLMAISSRTWAVGLIGIMTSQPAIAATLRPLPWSLTIAESIAEPTVEAATALAEAAMPTASPLWVHQAFPSSDRWWRCPSSSVALTSASTPNTTSASDFRFPIQFQGCVVGYVSDAIQAQVISARLERELQNSPLDWQTVMPKQVGERIILHRGPVPLFTLEPAIAAQFDTHPHELAIDWANRIRLLAGQLPLPLAEAQKQLYEVTETALGSTGAASWYGPYFHGRQTANGEIYDQQDLTAAHRTLPLGSYVKVTHQRSGKSVVVRINDRGPYYDEDQRIIDLSQRAAQILGGADQGVMPINLVELRSVPALTASSQTIALNPIVD